MSCQSSPSSCQSSPTGVALTSIPWLKLTETRKVKVKLEKEDDTVKEKWTFIVSDGNLIGLKRHGRKRSDYTKVVLSGDHVHFHHDDIRIDISGLGSYLYLATGEIRKYINEGCWELKSFIKIYD